MTLYPLGEHRYDPEARIGGEIVQRWPVNVSDWLLILRVDERRQHAVRASATVPMIGRQMPVVRLVAVNGELVA